MTDSATARVTGGFIESADLDAAAESLVRMGLTDGLPIIVPTPERVDRMLLASGRPRDVAVASMPPSHGAATVEKIAVAAVMAGCMPEFFPVVVAAVEAICDDQFELETVQSTTHDIAPLVIVNGPARWACGPINSSTGCLGPGFRANATIGRALRLALFNIGGGYPGAGDPSTGQPAKFTFCTAEDEDNSPFPPFHTSQGFALDDSAVTVVGVEGPHSVRNISDDAGAADALVTQMAQVLAVPAVPTSERPRSSVNMGVIVLNPAHAQVLADAGYTRETLRLAIAERATYTAASQRRMYGKLGGIDPSVPDDALFGEFDESSMLVMIVAGAPSAYSSVMPGCNEFGYPISRRIELDQACELPGRRVD